MKISSLRQNKTRSLCIVISTLLILLFISPLAVFAQDQDSIDVLRRMGKAFASIAEKTSPAVVSLTSERTITREYPSMQDWPFGEPFSDPFEFFFRRRSPQQRSPQRQQPRRYREPRTAQGSGFIISADGYILTNNHMVEGAEKVEIELTDGRKFTAKIIGADSDSDVAVVKIIDDSDLPYLELADSDTLEVGEWVLAIGNPLGLSHTVTAGIVSAKGRSGFNLAPLENFIQTDAAINFGNSGGPLINLDGKVVGINTAIAGSTGNIGIGFAIPINMARHVYEQLIESGTVERGFLGVLPQDLEPEMAKAFGLKNGKGVLIPDVTKDSAADKAGVKHNDIVLELNGEPVESADAFRNRIAMLKPGAKVKLVVWRDGKRKTITVPLGKRPTTDELTGNLPKETVEELGFTVQDLTDELIERYGYEGQSGVVVSSVDSGSQAERKGIAPGALIREVNQQKVRNTKEFNDAIKKAKKDGGAVLLVKRGRYTFFSYLELSDK